jgi:FkbM family methyltransferase
MKPEYVLRPRQLLRRLRWSLAPPGGCELTAPLPWGLGLRVRTDDELGMAVVQLGVYELLVTEALWRLCDEGETALDIGANIGYATSILARRVGPRGRVVTFEAHPAIYEELLANISAWQAALPETAFDAHCVALSDRCGQVRLEVPNEFAHNRGLCRVSEAAGDTGATSLTVPANMLDCLFGSDTRVGVAKMDVELHEEAVLRGARRLLAAGAVRDWVFEHYAGYPSAVTSLLEGYGYTVFRLRKKFFRPLLVGPAESGAESTWEAPSYLATLDRDRAAARFRPAGWQALGAR